MRTQVERLSEGRIAGLDGIRAIACGLVVVSHALFHAHALTDGDALALHTAYGEAGVVLFFALSGFLITTLLLREHTRAERISLRAFYLRRTLRIWPVWYVYLAAVAAMVAGGVLTANSRSWVGAATYVLNVVPGHHGDALAHGWSLAIEEQFYLVWPLALIVILAKARRPIVPVAVLALTAPLWRGALWVALPVLHQFGWEGTPSRAGALLAGCLVAMLLFDPAWRERFEQSVRPASVLLAVGIAVVGPVLSILTDGSSRFEVVVGLSMFDLPLAFLVGAVVVSPASAAVRALSWWPVALVGLMSYSLYVWQQAFLFNPALPLLVALPVTFVAGFLSWQLIELRTGRLKDRLLGARPPLVRRLGSDPGRREAQDHVPRRGVR